MGFSSLIYDVNIIRCIWVFWRKKKSNDYFKRYNAPLVGDDMS